MRRVAGVLFAAGVLALWSAPAAGAAIPDVLGGDVSCDTQGDGVRFCGSVNPDRTTTKTFDGVPIDVNVAFPPQPSGAPDGDYPLMMIFHGYGGVKIPLNGMRRFLDRGYAVFSMTTRGFRESCGSEASQAADPAGCADGYVRLMDTRYEVRDAQELAAALVDEGLAHPHRIGAIGGSYGGGMSMALAALRDRKMLTGGALVPWTSPDGTPMRIAGAAPDIPWTDLAYSLTPNGSTLDYVADSPYRGRIGVMKQSYVNGLFFSGLSAPGFYAPEGSNPSADLRGWKALFDAGEPYDGNPAAEQVLDEFTARHSSYYIDSSRPPAPLLISNGTTDDLFPPDEAIRFYNRTRTQHPDSPIALFFADMGHPRGQNKGDDVNRLRELQDAWLDHYVKGTGPEPPQGVQLLTQTCPGSEPSGGPVEAENWATLSPGEVRFGSPEPQTIAPNAGSDEIGEAFNPIGGSACAQVSGETQPETATYLLPPAPRKGYTLSGSPTVIADFELAEPNSQVAVRLLDMDEDDQERLVARALWRPRAGGPHEQVMQLHPNGWRFEDGHVAKLELLPKDSGSNALSSYGRPSNGQGPVTVSNLKLRLPVVERPGWARGTVKAPAPKLVPGGLELARDFAELPTPNARLGKGRLRAKNRKRMHARVRCPAEFHACNAIVRVRAARKGKRFPIAKGEVRVRGGKGKRAKLKLTRKARKRLGSKRRTIRAQVRLRTREQIGRVQTSRRVRLPKRR